MHKLTKSNPSIIHPSAMDFLLLSLFLGSAMISIDQCWSSERRRTFGVNMSHRNGESNDVWLVLVLSTCCFTHLYPIYEVSHRYYRLTLLTLLLTEVIIHLLNGMKHLVKLCKLGPQTIAQSWCTAPISLWFLVVETNWLDGVIGQLC